MKILIIGAGIGGLTAALALRQRGHAVLIAEQAPGFAPAGAGIQLSPNAMQVFDALGLKSPILAHGFEPQAAVIRNGYSGAVVLKTSLKGACERRYGQPYVHIHRADLHAALVAAAETAGVEIRLGHCLASSDADAGTSGFTNGETLRADLIIGADGVRSTVQALTFDAVEPEFTGQVAWRALVPAARVPQNLISPDATVWRGRGRHLVTYYVKSGAFINLVAVEERGGGWRGPRVQTADPGDLRAAFRDFHPCVKTLLDAVAETDLWALFDRPPLAAWTKGRVALLGDACHPVLPFMAQGAAMAVEDAFVLAKMLSDRGLGPSGLRTGLLAYEAARKPRTSMMQKRSRANTAIFHTHKTPAGILAELKFFAVRRAPKLAFTVLDPLYGADVTQPEA